MPEAIIMPKLGQTVEEATLVKWHKKEQDAVKKGEVLFEIETDKAVLEVESFYDGVVLKVLVHDGETVPVNAVVAFVGDKGEAVSDDLLAKAAASQKVAAAPAAAAPTPTAPVPAVAPAAATAAPAAAPVAAPVAPAAPAAPGRLRISPRARKFARESAIDPSGVTGSGPNGRIMEKDVKAYMDAQGYGQLRVTPSARKLAAAEGIDVLTVSGTGRSGRIMMSDIHTAVAEKPKPLSKMRQVIASRLTQSFTSTPHFYVTVSVDMTDLLAFRGELKASGQNIGVTAFILKAVIQSLEEFPAVNSVSDGQTISWHSSVELGMAVGLDDGLVVPVISDASDLVLEELHDVSKELAEKARDGKLLPDEMTGSTFTVSNMGMLGVDSFCAIINPGEAGILAIGSTVPTPVVKDGEIVVRSIMKITLSTDHRIVDGGMGAAFSNAIKDKLEDMELWKSLT